MAAEDFPGEKQFIDNIDTAVQAYFDAYKLASEMGNPELDMPDGAVCVGWVLGIQYLAPPESDNDDDTDGHICFTSPTMSVYAGLGLATVMTAEWTP